MDDLDVELLLLTDADWCRQEMAGIDRDALLRQIADALGLEVPPEGFEPPTPRSGTWRSIP